MPPVSPGSRRRVFAPSLAFTLIALVLAAIFVRLGFWQWHRGVSRQEQWTRYARGTEQVRPLAARSTSEVPLFQRVSVSGQLDSGHQFLLDNRIHDGRPGYEVLTPLARPGAPALLVDRGWVPFTGSRARLPQIDFTPPATVVLSGRVASLPSPGLALGRAPPAADAVWPKVTSYPDMTQLSGALGMPLEAHILLLDPGAPFGYVREWRAPGLSPLRHFSYAIQWWSFAALALVGWVVMSRRPAAEAGR